MTFEEEFKSWTLDQKVEWALGPKIFNLSEKMRSIIVDLKADNERLNRELKQMDVQDQVVFNGLRKENERLKGEVNRLEATEESLADEQVKILDERDGLRKENERLNGEIWKMESKQSGYEHFLRKENAKLKCLALHGMFGYACAKMNVLAEEYEKEFASGMVHKDFSRWHRLSRLWREAYRKAKQALREVK